MVSNGWRGREPWSPNGSSRSYTAWRNRGLDRAGDEVEALFGVARHAVEEAPKHEIPECG
jgi:hypothetical protein